MSSLFRALSGHRLQHLQPPPERNALDPVVDALRRDLALLKGSRGGPGPFRAFGIDPQSIPGWYQGEKGVDSHLGTDGLSYMDLRRIARMSFVAPFWRRRINQITARCRPQRNPNQPGYILRHSDPKEKLGDAHMKVIEDIEQRMNRVNAEIRRGGFRQNLKAMLVGRFEFDQFNAEVVLDRGKRPWAWQPVDPASIRRGMPSQSEIDRGTWGKDYFCQIVDDKIVNEWDSRHMVFETCRPYPDIHNNGYGWPEIAEAFDIIQDIENARTYNSVYFRNGVHASTILILKAAQMQESIDDIRAELTALMKGKDNAHRMLLFQLHPGSGDQKPEKLEKIDLAQSNRDMEFSHLFGFLFRLFAAAMQMDLAEIGIGDPADTRPSQIGGEGSPDAAVGIAREGGLEPLVDDVRDIINVNFVKRIHPDFEIALEGPELSQQSRVTVYAQAINSYRSIDEIRSQDGLEPFNEDWSKMPLNPSVVQLFMQSQQMQQQAQQGGQPGGAPGGDPNDPNATQQPGAGQPPAVGDGSDVDWNDPKSWTEGLGKAITRRIDNGEILSVPRAPTHRWGRSGARFALGAKGERTAVVEV